MRVLHTADWHLADKLGRQDRTAGLQKQVEVIADICQQENVDVLLVAGDLFYERASRDALRHSVSHLVETFGKYLRDGGTIVAITGNHDRDDFCGVIRDAFRLASPVQIAAGGLAPSGRFHLHTGPTYFRLADRGGQEVQFVSMPFPTGARYLQGDAQKYTTQEERRRNLSAAVHQQLIQIQRRLEPSLPSILSAHLTVDGAQTSGLFRMTESEDMVFQNNLIAGDFDYVALGHIHCEQTVGGRIHARYSGSIERLDQGERNDDKSVTLFDIDRSGLVGQPRLIPLAATPLYTLTIDDFETQFPQFESLYPDAQQALVKYELIYEPGVDNLPEMQHKLNQFFPRWHDRTFSPRRATGSQPETAWHPAADANPDAIARAYFEQQLAADNPDRDDILQLLDQLLTEQP